MEVKVNTEILQDSIKLSLYTEISELKERKPLPKAPGLEAGCPSMKTMSLSTQVVIPDGATIVLANTATKETSVLCFATAKVVKDD